MFQLLEWILVYAWTAVWTLERVSLPVLEAMGLMDEHDLVYQVLQNVVWGMNNKPDIIQEIINYVLDQQSQIGTPSGSLPFGPRP